MQTNPEQRMEHPLQQISFHHKHGNAYVIEASAGTGKTWTIERLVVKALLEGNMPSEEVPAQDLISNLDNASDLPVTINNILVVTFTIDATNELKSRILEQIQNTINTLIILRNWDNRKELDPRVKPEDDNICWNDNWMDSRLHGNDKRDCRATASNYENDADIVDNTSNSDVFIDYLQTLAGSGEQKIRNALTILTRAMQNFDQAAIFTIHGFCKRILQDFQYECNTPAHFKIVSHKHNIIKDLVRNFIREKIVNNPELNVNLNCVFDNLFNLFKNGQGDLIDRISTKIPENIFTIQNHQYKLNYDLPSNPNLSLLKEPLDSNLQIAVKSALLTAVIEYVHKSYSKYLTNDQNLSFNELIQLVADSVEHNPQLAKKIHLKYPVAFIDEFQDTDALQWQIFSRIYHLDQTHTRGQVVVVGDPKQAIYRFRGADVDTYIKARTQINQHLELGANYRSHLNIMNFVNQLFAETNQLPHNADFLGNDISYHSIVAAVNADKLASDIPGSEELHQLCESRQIPVSKFYDDQVQIVAISGMNSEERNLKIYQAVTFEILALLNKNPTLKGKIAILVTKNREAQEFVKILNKHGVAATELKLGNIYATTTAKDILTILQSIHDLANRSYFINAITRQMFNLPLDKLRLDSNIDNPELERLQQQFFNYQQIWQKDGIISLIYALVEGVCGSSQNLSNRDLANLWQLAELIHKQSHINTNHEELIHWLRNKIKNSDNIINEDVEGSHDELIRLDNDDDQIIVTTQHKSKGLEYEILFCPFFRANAELDRSYDFGYHRPFFTNSVDPLTGKPQLVIDKTIGSQIISNDNKEANRLNYVALTRAKSRIYIYLKSHTIKNNKYHHAENPAKIVELFGYTKYNPYDTTHPLFNYPNFFSNNPHTAIKAHDLLPGVVAYDRNHITSQTIDKLKLTQIGRDSDGQIPLSIVSDNINLKYAYKRQSYTMLTHVNTDVFDINSVSDYFVSGETIISSIEDKEVPTSTYSILSDKNCSGATFGLLFHELCENYPYTSEQLTIIMAKHNLTNDERNYHQQLTEMLDIAFNFELFTDKTTLKDLATQSMHELEFNLAVNKVDIGSSIHNLLADYFGITHPFTIASKSLQQIEPGFLTGFIDLMFMHEGKYWVLDYKTNRLDDYQSTSNPIDDVENPLIISMAHHHYYLQYLLYLVAVKRYLEQRLQIDDASHLIGGSVYYYVRGLYVDNNKTQAVYCDHDCRDLVAQLDTLLKGGIAC
jgi:exodeoxyribonuclease V beta subunit